MPTLTSAIIVFFDAESPVAFVQAEQPGSVCFAGLRDDKFASVSFPVAEARQAAGAARKRLVQQLRACGVNVSDVGEEIPVPLKVAFIELRLSRNPGLWRRIEQWFWIHAPYAYTQLRSGKWLAINRYYKPLGQPRSEWADYEQFADAPEHFICHPAKFKRIWAAVGASLGMMWLYNDDPQSRRDYFSRLLKLDDYSVLPGEEASPR